MKKLLCVLILGLLLSSFVFAGEFISLGGAYGFLVETTDDIALHGPGIDLKGISDFKNSKTFFYSSNTFGFPLEVATNGIKVKRDQFDILFSVDAAAGIGLRQDIKKMPLSIYAGAGLGVSLITSANPFAKGVDFAFGANLLAGALYKIQKDLFVDFALKTSIYLYSINHIETALIKTTTQGSIFGAGVNASVGLCYKFDFE